MAGIWVVGDDHANSCVLEESSSTPVGLHRLFPCLQRPPYSPIQSAPQLDVWGFQYLHHLMVLAMFVMPRPWL